MKDLRDKKKEFVSLKRGKQLAFVCLVLTVIQDLTIKVV